MGREVYLSGAGRGEKFGSFEVWVDRLSLVYTYNETLMACCYSERGIDCPKLQMLKVE